MEVKFKLDYDLNEDVLYAYSEKAKTKESLELTRDIIVDLDKKDNIVGIEILNAYKFLHTLNQEITKNMLSELDKIKLKFIKYGDYIIITLIFEQGHKIIKERLPPFPIKQYESPLIVSVA